MVLLSKECLYIVQSNLSDALSNLKAEVLVPESKVIVYEQVLSVFVNLMCRSLTNHICRNIKPELDGDEFPGVL